MSGTHISPLEIERVVTTLTTYSAQDVGSAPWMRQRETIEALNLQAHACAASNSDEYVTEAFTTLEQVSLLVHELVVAEAWAELVGPPLLPLLPPSSSTVKPYLVLFHQATLANLLQVVLFSQPAVLSLTDEAMIELADYCLRKVATLHPGSSPFDMARIGPGADLLARDNNNNNNNNNNNDDDEQKEGLSPGQDILATQMEKIRFDTAIIAVSLLRYLTDLGEDAPIGLNARLMRVHDTPMALIPLVHSPPWIASGPVVAKKSGKRKIKLHVYADGKWSPMSSKTMGMCSQTDVQVWLCLYNLLMEPETRRLYPFDSRKSDALNALTGSLTPQVLEQIPVLSGFARFLHELALSPPADTGQSASPLVLETLAVIREAVLDSINELGAVTLAYAFLDSMTAESEEDVKAYMNGMAANYTLDALDAVLDPPKCAVCGDDAVNRCSRCKSEWYCGRECQVGAWDEHKVLCDLLSQPQSQ